MRADASVTPERSPSALRSTTAAAPSLGEHNIHRWSGSHTRRDASTSSAVTSLRNIASGLSTPCRRFFTTTAARSALVSPCSRSSRCARNAKYAGVAASPDSSRHGSKNEERIMPFGIFSTPNTSAQSYCPARIAPRRELERGASARAARLHVDDRHPGAGERTEHLVARRHAAVRGTAERRLEVGLAGFGQRGAHCVHAHVGVREVVEAPEPMDADAGYFDANAHVTTPSCNSSATSVIGCPKVSAAGSASVRRVTMRQAFPSELHHAEPVGHRPFVARGRRGDRRPTPERALTRQRDALHVGRARVGADVEEREVVLAARRRVPADEIDAAVVVHLEQTVVHGATTGGCHTTPRVARSSRSVSESPSAPNTSRVCAPSRGAPAGGVGASPATRGKGACCRTAPITGSSTVTRSRRCAKCGSAKMSAAV